MAPKKVAAPAGGAPDLQVELDRERTIAKLSGALWDDRLTDGVHERQILAAENVQLKTAFAKSEDRLKLSYESFKEETRKKDEELVALRARTAELESRVTRLPLDIKAAVDLTKAALELDINGLKTKLKDREAALEKLADFRNERDKLLERLDMTMGQLEKEQEEHATDIAMLQKANIQDREHVRQVLMEKLRDTKASIMSQAAGNLSEGVKRLVAENDMMLHELAYQSKQAERLAGVTDGQEGEIAFLRRALSINQGEMKELLHQVAAMSVALKSARAQLDKVSSSRAAAATEGLPAPALSHALPPRQWIRAERVVLPALMAQGQGHPSSVASAQAQAQANPPSTRAPEPYRAQYDAAVSALARMEGERDDMLSMGSDMAMVLLRAAALVREHLKALVGQEQARALAEPAEAEAADIASSGRPDAVLFIEAAEALGRLDGHLHSADAFAGKPMGLPALGRAGASGLRAQAGVASANASSAALMPKHERFPAHLMSGRDVGGGALLTDRSDRHGGHGEAEGKAGERTRDFGLRVMSLGGRASSGTLSAAPTVHGDRLGTPQGSGMGHGRQGYRSVASSDEHSLALPRATRDVTAVYTFLHFLARRMMADLADMQRAVPRPLSVEEWLQAQGGPHKE